jgi:hypothetical protein
MNRVLLRPSGQDEDVYNFILGGPNIDYDKISPSSEEFAKFFYSLIKRTDILFGDIVWISKYKSERAFTYADLVHVRPNIRMVNTLRVRRVLVAGGQLSNFFRFIAVILCGLCRCGSLPHSSGRPSMTLLLRMDRFIHCLNSKQGMNSSIQDSVSFSAAWGLCHPLI